MSKGPPPIVFYVFIAIGVFMAGLGIKHYFFDDKHGIKQAEDQHESYTQDVIRKFKKKSGVYAKYKVTWTEETCPHDDPDRNVSKGQTAVLHHKPNGEVVCLHGITHDGCDSFVAWRGEGEGALVHELGHCGRLKSKKDKLRSDPGHEDREWWDLVNLIDAQIKKEMRGN